MKKNVIWLLTALMAVAFAGLLYLQIMYVESMVKMRQDQFAENVRRSLHGVAIRLEQDENRYFLEEDLSGVEATSVFAPYAGPHPGNRGGVRYSFTTQSGLNADLTIKADEEQITLLQADQRDFASRYRTMRGGIPSQFNQYGVINDLILNIVSQTVDRPIKERVDSAVVSRYISEELSNCGIVTPFEVALVNRDNVPVYHSDGFSSGEAPEGTLFVKALFPNDPPSKAYFLKVYFPRRNDYVMRSLSFVIPSFILSFILLALFIFTVVVAFRQKKVTEMKNDFINNMTHEFKTPISTISLAAQMLNDDSVRKSPALLQHASSVINDETKRLRFQVEKVLQMSMFDRGKVSMRMQEVDANSIIYNIVNTFKMKVERYGGAIDAQLDADDAIVMVDEMHFTNVIFNLLDNAVKYRREDTPLHLSVTTRDINNGESLEITVGDNGIGIRKEDLKKIFERFYRVHTGNRHDVKGFGLGLAYVHRMVKLLHGNIRVESELNEGTKFIIILPLNKN